MSEDTFDLMAAFSEQLIRIQTIELAINAALASGNPHAPVTEAEIVKTLMPILEVHQKAKQLIDPEPDTGESGQGDR